MPQQYRDSRHGTLTRRCEYGIGSELKRTMNALACVGRKRSCIFVCEQDELASVKYAVVLVLFVFAALRAIWMIG